MLRTSLLAFGCCFSALAAAADNGVYVGAGVVQSDYGLENPGDIGPFDDEASGFKAILGWRPLDSFGIELDYADHGNAVVPAGIVCTQFITVPCPFQSRLESRTLSAFAVGYLDFPVVDLFAKAGATSWDFEVRALPVNSGFFAASDSGTELAWGAGAQAHFGSLGVRLEYEQLNIIDDEKLGSISLSFIYTFL